MAEGIFVGGGGCFGGVGRSWYTSMFILQRDVEEVLQSQSWPLLNTRYGYVLRDKRERFHFHPFKNLLGLPPPTRATLSNNATISPTTS